MPVEAWKFDHLPSQIGRLINGWFDRAWDARDSIDAETFEPFIYCWIAFNAWSTCVTGIDQDSRIIDRLSGDAKLEATFATMLTQEPEFRAKAEAFRQWWPIFRAQSIRRANLLFETEKGIQGRRQRVEFLLAADPRIPRSPETPENPKAAAADFPLTWDNSLHAIYRVRCNLFHGDKSVTSEVDAAIVGAAYRVLVHFFASVALLRENPTC